MDAVTGRISGTPTKVQTSKTYKLSGANTGGSMTYTQHITVIAEAPTGLRYDSPWTWTLGQTYKESMTLNHNAFDGGATVTFTVKPSLPAGVSLNSATGDISGTPTDLKPWNSTYTVTATNTGGSTSTKIYIRVIAQPPMLSYSPRAFVWIHKQAISGTEVKQTRANKYAAITKCVSSPPLPAHLVLNQVTCEIGGHAGVITWPPRTYTVTASNTGGSVSAMVSIGIKAIAPTSLWYTGGETEKLTVDTETVSNLLGLGNELGFVDLKSDPIVSYTVHPPLPKGLYLDGKSSLVSGVAKECQAPTLYTFTASNTGGAASYEQFIEIVGIAPTDLAYAKAAFTFTLGRYVEETPTINKDSMDGGAQLVYSIDKPLMPGMHFSTRTGAIHGVPTQLNPAGETYIVTATNTGGSTTVAVTLRVIAVCPKLAYQVPEAEYISVRDSSPVDAVITNVAGVNATLTSCSVTPALPSGLSLNTSTCQITGTATVQTYSPKQYKVTGMNSCGNSTTTVKQFVKAIKPTDYSLSGGKKVTVIVDEVMETETVKISGDPVTDWQVVPPLPEGLILNNDGTISGTPTELQLEYIPYFFFASNTGGVAVFIQEIRVIAQKPTGLGYDGEIGSVAWVWTEGDKYNETPHVDSGTAGGATLTYSITGDNLPTGTSFDTATGVISGIPTELVLTDRTYTVTVTNSGGSASIAVKIKVIAVAPKIEYTPKIHNKFIHKSRVTPVDVTNTAGKYSVITSCSITPSLPVGLTLSSTCVVSGTPTVISWPADHYIVTAKNSGGSSSASVIIGVRAIKPTMNMLTTGLFQHYVMDQPIASAFTMVDQWSDPIISTSVSPALPAGLTLDANGTVYGTPKEEVHGRDYKFTVSNSGGVSAWVQNITVRSEPKVPYVYLTTPLERKLHECTGAKETTLGQKFAQCSTSLDSVKAASKAAEAREAESKEKLNALKENVKTMNGQLSQYTNLNSQYQDLTSQYSTLQKSKADLSAEYSTLETKDAKLKKDNAKLTTSFTASQERERQMETKYDEATKNITSMTKEMTSMTKDITSMKTRLMKVAIVKSPPVSFKSSEKFSVSAQLVNWEGKSQISTEKVSISLVGGSGITGAVTSDFSTGTATFSDLSVEAGKYRMYFETSSGITQASSLFKVRVADVKFTHTILGMTEEVWKRTETKTAYRMSVAEHMGVSVTHEDVTIESTSTRITTTGLEATSSVTLCDRNTAQSAMSSFEKSLQPPARRSSTIPFDKTFSKEATKLGVALPKSVKSGGLTGTKSSDVPAPTMVPIALASSSSGIASATPSDTSSSSDNSWKIAAIALMCVVGVAAVAGVTALLVTTLRQPTPTPEASSGSDSKVQSRQEPSSSVTAISIDGVKGSEVELEVKETVNPVAAAAPKIPTEVPRAKQTDSRPLPPSPRPPSNEEERLASYFTQRGERRAPHIVV
jgi:hypothetical protein